MKWLIIFLTLVLAISFVSSANNEIILNCGGNQELQIFCSYGSEDNQFVGGLAGPLIELIQYKDNAEDSDGILDFIYRPIDKDGVKSCSLYFEDEKVKTDNNVTSDQKSRFHIENAPRTNALDWYVTCEDNLNNTGVSETRTLKTRIGSGGDGTEDSAVYNKSLLCDTSYPEALKEEPNISKIKETYNSNTNLSRVPTYKIINHTENWQSMCSDITMRTLKPEFVCNNIYDTYVENDLDPTYEQRNQMRLDIQDEINLSQRLNNHYFNNYNQLCVQKDYSPELPEEDEGIPTWVWVSLGVLIILIIWWERDSRRRKLALDMLRKRANRSITTMEELERQSTRREA